MKAFSDCDEVEKIGRIGDGIIVLELLLSWYLYIPYDHF